MKHPLRIGDPAPDIAGLDQHGRTFSLQAHLGKVIVVFFYPKDHTPACTAQSCGFRDAYEEFVAAGAIVVGVSTGSVDSHAGFALRHSLPFTLIADTGAIRAAWRVPKTLGLFPGRVTYVINAQGRVGHVFNSQLRVGTHVQSALVVVKQLALPPTSATPA